MHNPYTKHFYTSSSRPISSLGWNLTSAYRACISLPFLTHIQYCGSTLHVWKEHLLLTTLFSHLHSVTYFGAFQSNIVDYKGILHVCRFERYNPFLSLAENRSFSPNSISILLQVRSSAEIWTPSLQTVTFKQDDRGLYRVKFLVLHILERDYFMQRQKVTFCLPSLIPLLSTLLIGPT